MKRGKILLFVLVLSLIALLPLFSQLILAGELEHAEFGYECLENVVASRGCDSLTTEQKAFALLGIKECREELIADMHPDNHCWSNSGSGCEIKATALAIFALNDRRFDTSLSEEWLLTQTQAAPGLDWFLEVETESPSYCTVKYDTNVYEFYVTNEKKLTANAGPCLIRTPEHYWFEIQPSCFEKEFRITCNDAPFLTTLLFKKQGSSTYNVVGKVSNAEPIGETNESVVARCFKQGNSCTYEGTLWATFALWAQGMENRDQANVFLPYLIAMKEDNSRFLPEALLYFMTGKFQSELLDKQRYNSYWETSGNRYYDTAMALFPMKAESNPQKAYAITWLLEHQDNSGCWNNNNLVDTAFILRSLWPQYSPECKTDNDCGSSEKCNTTTSTCYRVILPPEPECDDDQDCIAIDPDWLCDEDVGECYDAGGVQQQCDDDQDCIAKNPDWLCDEDVGECYDAGGTQGCKNDNDCTVPGKEHCDISDGKCYECLINGHCNFLAGERCSADGTCYIPGGYECGNNLKEPGEQCDGSDLNNKDCDDIMSGSGWLGDLGCFPSGDTDECIFDTSGCHECDDDEDCEGDEVCNDEGSCVPPIPPEPFCGDGKKDNGEECDLYDYNGETCETKLGKGWSGSLHCNEDCTIDSSDCEEGSVCTWNFQCPGEQICEGGKCVDKPPEPECEDDYDCPGDKVCENETCVPPGPECTSDDDCEGDEVCENNYCVSPSPECTWDFQCPDGQICENRFCVDKPPGPECEDDFDCLGDKVCENEVCVDPPPKPECTWDFQCPADQVCENEVCVDPPPKPECEDDFDCPGDEICENETCIPPGTECTSDDDCENGKVCENNYCVSPPPECTWDFQCSGDQICEGGKCVDPPPEPECENDFDCLGDKVCENEVCVDPPPKPECTWDFQCPADQVCENEVCVDKPPKPECTYDYDCASDEICENQHCIPINPEDCDWDWQCPGSDICVDGKCVNGTVPGECIFDWECSEGQICEAGVCINKTNVSCEDDFDCPFSYFCIGGFCVYRECEHNWECPGGDICVDGECISEEVECETDFDCPIGQECVAGKCLSPPSPNVTECETDFDCAWDQICVEGICSDEEDYDCEDSGYFCMPNVKCSGNILPLYSSSCSYPFECCDEPLPLKSCFEEGGEICSSNQECIGGIELNASDLEEGETCCTGEGYCLKKGSGESCETDNDCYDDEECVDGYCKLKYSKDCEDNGGVCRPNDCKQDEKTSYEYTCDYEDTCCMKEPSPGGNGIWLIVILLILIALVAAGIIFRDKLRVYWVKVKSKFGKGKGKPGKPPYGGRPGMYPPGPQGKPKKKNKFQEFLDKIKSFFTGKKQKNLEERNIPPRPLRGPLAVQHAQRQPQQLPAQKLPVQTPQKAPPIKPEPSKSTSTPFSQEKTSVTTSKKPAKKHKTKNELDEILEKLKKMGK